MPRFIPNYDVHNHTIHCLHAHESATVAACVEQAKDVGLQVFGFSEHVIFAQDIGRIDVIRDELRMVGDVEGLRVLVGAEMDADPTACDGSMVASAEGLDYVILSPHRMPGSGMGHWEYMGLDVTEDEKRVAGHEWLDWYSLCIETGGFDILGHPLREPMNLGLFHLDEDSTFERVLEIMQEAAKKGIAFELNNGWSHGLKARNDFQRYVELVCRVKEMGMRFSRGSDSHDIDHIGHTDQLSIFVELADIREDDWWLPV
jgi:histidinol phosphatase-like PHP family hydrolase